MDRLIATAAALPAAVVPSAEGERSGDKTVGHKIGDSSGTRAGDPARAAELGGLFGALFSLTLPNAPAAPTAVPGTASEASGSTAPGKSTAGARAQSTLPAAMPGDAGLRALLLARPAGEAGAPAPAALPFGAAKVAGTDGEIGPTGRVREPSHATQATRHAPGNPPLATDAGAPHPPAPPLVALPGPVPEALPTPGPPVAGAGTVAPPAHRATKAPGLSAVPGAQAARASDPTLRADRTATPKAGEGANAAGPSSPESVPRATPAVPQAATRGVAAPMSGPPPVQPPPGTDVPGEVTAEAPALRTSGHAASVPAPGNVSGTGTAPAPAPPTPQPVAATVPAAPDDAPPPEAPPAAGSPPADHQRPLELARNTTDASAPDDLDPAPVDAAPREPPRADAVPLRAAPDQAATPAAPSLGHSVARQVAAAAPLNLEHRPVEISLQPAELGHVRMTLSSHDGVMTLVIAAERPETLDLMRRHSDLLSGAFAGTGFAGLNLAFGQQGQSGRDFGQPLIPAAIDPATVDPLTPDRPAAPPPLAIRLALPAVDRLDLRL